MTEGSTYDNELPTGPHKSFESTKKKLICRLQRVRRDGWTAMSCGPRSSVSVGMEQAAPQGGN